MSRIEVTVVRAGGSLTLSWSDARHAGACRFDRLLDTVPEWLGSTEELLEGADRRTAPRVLDAVADWARSEGLELGVWDDDGGVEILHSPR